MPGRAYVIIKARMVNCRKKACNWCPHGPYHYARVPLRKGGRKTIYLGKELWEPRDAPHFRRLHHGGQRRRSTISSRREAAVLKEAATTLK